MDVVLNTTSDIGKKCIGRECGPELPGMSKKYYIPQRCFKKCETGSNLCKLCLKYETKYISSAKRERKWHGRATENIPYGSLLAGGPEYMEEVAAVAAGKVIKPRVTRKKTNAKNTKANTNANTKKTKAKRSKNSKNSNSNSRKSSNKGVSPDVVKATLTLPELAH